ncbi:MAG TPA: cytochrome c peroxidase [Thermoleophilia bacterium]|nr:cytochrome c peroxidase [Thermoleophilia bacterium]
MSSKIVRLCLLLGAVVLLIALAAMPVAAMTRTANEVWLGALLYSDTALSDPDGQSCASCHTPRAGFADPDRCLPVSEGVNRGDFGGRNAPTAAYTTWSPDLQYDADGDAWVGGMFWDGRATGLDPGLSPLAMQAKGPFLNDIEMSNDSEADVIDEVRKASYRKLFLKVYGPDSLDDVYAAYDNVARAIAAYESSRLVNTFSSRYDAYRAGASWVLTRQEKRGLRLFNGKALCNQCHPSAPDPAISTGIASGKALFTDYTYDNLGLPQNPEAVMLSKGDGSPDLGLGGFLNDSTVNGAFKVPTLRNVARTAPYGHNGYFATLAEIVHFYNTRDVPSAGWEAPEYPDTMNVDELGDLGLTSGQEKAIVAFMKTLTDRVIVPIPDR